MYFPQRDLPARATAPASTAVTAPSPTIAAPQRNGLGYRRLKAWLGLASIFAILAYSSELLDGAPDPADLLFRYSTSLSGAVAYAILALPLLLIVSGLPKRNLLALRPPAAWSWALGAGAAIVAADFVVVYLYEWILGPFTEGDVPAYWDAARVPQFALSFVLIAVLAPVYEEFMYRGVGYGLLERFGPGMAIGVTGVFFGLAHGYLYVLPLFIWYGVALGWLRMRTGSIYPGMLVHGATNATALTLSAALA